MKESTFELKIGGERIMAFDVTRVESMQWNRTHTKMSLEAPQAETGGQNLEISPEILAQVRAAISAEVEKSVA
jgi:hypothetical protein